MTIIRSPGNIQWKDLGIHPHKTMHLNTTYNYHVYLGHELRLKKKNGPGSSKGLGPTVIGTGWSYSKYPICWGTFQFHQFPWEVYRVAAHCCMSKTGHQILDFSVSMPALYFQLCPLFVWYIFSLYQCSIYLSSMILIREQSCNVKEDRDLFYLGNMVGMLYLSLSMVSSASFCLCEELTIIPNPTVQCGCSYI